MPLKYKVLSRDQLPAEFAPLYVERDGAWVVDLDGAVAQDTLELARATHESQISALTVEREHLQARLAELEFNQSIYEHASRIDVLPRAVSDLLQRARQVFQFREGKVVALNADNQSGRQGKSGPLTITEWCEALREEAPHLFVSKPDVSAASNVPTPRADKPAPPPAQKPNPFKSGPHWNVTEQMRVHRADPVQADKLRAAAAT